MLCMLCAVHLSCCVQLLLCKVPVGACVVDDSGGLPSVHRFLGGRSACWRLSHRRWVAATGLHKAIFAGLCFSQHGSATCETGLAGMTCGGIQHYPQRLQVDRVSPFCALVWRPLNPRRVAHVQGLCVLCCVFVTGDVEALRGCCYLMCRQAPWSSPCALGSLAEFECMATHVIA